MHSYFEFNCLLLRILNALLELNTIACLLFSFKWKFINIFFSIVERRLFYLPKNLFICIVEHRVNTANTKCVNKLRSHHSFAVCHCKCDTCNVFLCDKHRIYCVSKSLTVLDTHDSSM